MPRQSIPDFRLPKDVADRELGHILDLGVRVLTNTEVGRDVSLREIMERHDACLLAVGSRRERMLSIPGIGHALPAVSFLREANLSRRSLAGKRVVILGGGGVAFDCAFTARRLGAESVSLICPETRDAVRVPRAEVEQADDEGVVLHAGYLAAAVECGEGNVVRAVTADAVSSFSFDEAGTLRAEFVPGGRLRVEADVVICASGLLPDLSLLEGEGGLPGVERTPRGCVKTLHSAASLPGLFAAGECASGPSLVASAIAGGRAAAFDIHAWLNGPLTCGWTRKGVLRWSGRKRRRFRMRWSSGRSSISSTMRRPRGTAPRLSHRAAHGWPSRNWTGALRRKRRGPKRNAACTAGTVRPAASAWQAVPG